jgi:hypothetical protein
MEYQLGMEVALAVLLGLFGCKVAFHGPEQPVKVCKMSRQADKRYLVARPENDPAMHLAQTSTRHPHHSFAFGHLL